MGFLKFRSRADVPTPPRAPAGMRAYAVGDVHGRLDLLADLLDRIEADVRERPAARVLVIFLGDLIDRGPESRGVIERLRKWAPAWARPVFLAGNHEEAMLRALDGDSGVLRDWLHFGGAECVRSYGVDPQDLAAASDRQALEALQAAVPPSHVSFLRDLADSLRFGDYLFVHAGIRPGVPLEEQAFEDLRWIRDPFLSYEGSHGFVVVHGHTIVDEVEVRDNRIGIDTGAYRSGRLTCLGLEEDRRWFLTAETRAGAAASPGRLRSCPAEP